MFALPSPPVDSERMPGMLRKISAVERGAERSMVSGVTLLVEMLVRSLDLPPAVAVTTISEK